MRFPHSLISSICAIGIICSNLLAFAVPAELPSDKHQKSIKHRPQITRSAEQKNKNSKVKKTVSTPKMVAHSLKAVSSAQGIQQGLDQILNQEKSKIHIGILVRRTDTNIVLYNHEGNYLFAPASVMKILTAVAALDYLGPNFHFATQFVTNGSITQNVINGDLFIKFSGDPYLTSHDLTQLVDDLKKRGINTITGNVYIDASAYSPIPYPPGCMWDDLSFSYAVPITAVIINRNRFAFRILPTANLQPPAIIPLIPPRVATFDNHAVTTAQSYKSCPFTVYSDGGNHFRLDGCFNRAWGSQVRTMALRNPEVYARGLIQSLLQTRGISFHEPVQYQKAPLNALVLVEHDSPSLVQLLKRMLKRSDNLITNTLFKKLGESYFHDTGTWQNGLQALKNILRPSGVNFSKNLIADGAGLSRYNLISPLDLVQVLDYAYRKPELRNILWVALPISGIDGTLGGRMGGATTGRVHAKTGTMTGVSCLAGYVNNVQHGPLTFAIMVNGFIGKAGPYRVLEDRMCEFLTHYRGPL